jgi:hypothetical protein
MRFGLQIERQSFWPLRRHNRNVLPGNDILKGAQLRRADLVALVHVHSLPAQAFTFGHWRDGEVNRECLEGRPRYMLGPLTTVGVSGGILAAARE